MALLLAAGLGEVGVAWRLARAGALPHPVIFLHYDYMVAPDHSDVPDPKGIQMVVDAFKKHSIDLIIDPRHTAIPEHKVIAFHTTLDPKCV